MIDEGVVGSVVNGFVEAGNRRDPDALGALFAPSADFVIINGQRWKGRQEIQTNAAFLHGAISQDSIGVIVPAQTYGIFSSVTYRLDGVDVPFINRDVAIVHVSWVQLGDTRLQKPRRGMLTFVVARDRDRWLLNAAQHTLA